DEADGAHLGMIEQRINRRLIALYDVEDSGWEPRLFEQARHENRGRGVTLARLEDEGVAAGDRERKHPTWHHARKVEGRDACDYTERLTQLPVVEAGRYLIGEVTFQELRNAAGELDDLDSARHLALRVREHLAVLTGDELGERIAFAVEEREKASQHARTPQRRSVGPGWPGGPRTRNRGGHLAGAAESYLAQRCARRGIEHREARAFARQRLSADPVWYELRRGGACGRGRGRKRAGCHGDRPSCLRESAKRRS